MSPLFQNFEKRSALAENLPYHRFSQSDFLLVMSFYKPQFFSRSKIEISIEIPYGQHFGGALYFLHTQNHILCCCLFSTCFQNDVPLDTRTAPGGPQGKVGALSKQFHYKMENMLQKIVSGMKQQKKLKALKYFPLAADLIIRLCSQKEYFHQKCIMYIKWVL